MSSPEQTDYRLRLPALLEYRAAACRRRAAAFAPWPDIVMGTRCLSLTAPSFSILVASGNRFVCGGQEDFDDVLDYLWIHSPLYVPTCEPDWRPRKRRAVAPFMRLLTSRWGQFVIRFLQAFGHRHSAIGNPGRTAAHHSAAVVTLAIVEIRAIIEEAFADFPEVAGADSTPLATLEANLLHEFSRAYPGWSPERIRALPLKQLAQLHRRIRATRGEYVTDKGEQQIKANHLRARYAALEAAQSAPASVPSVPSVA